MIKTDHVQLKHDVSPNLLICKYCNGSHEMPTKPVAIPIYVAIINAFIKMHKKCKPQKND